MRTWWLFVAALLTATPAVAHPTPFSYLDVHLDGRAISGSLVVHGIDAAHELNLSSPDTLVDASVVDRHAAKLAALLAPRLTFTADGRALVWTLVNARPLVERSALTLTWRVADPPTFGHLVIGSRLFPYDPEHQTFVNVYEGEILVRQDVLNKDRTSADCYTGTRQGAIAVFRAFTASGIHHIAIGPDHILFIIGLLLLGGSVPRLLAIVSAFTIGHSVTLSLAALDVVNPPANLVEPAIALSIVYVGADNLLLRAKGRDIRPWIALFFGLVHGFGFASVLRETGLASRALAASLFSFNLGVEIGQAVIVVAVAGILRIVGTRNPGAARRIATTGSVLVTAAGVYWFVQRVS